MGALLSSCTSDPSKKPGPPTPGPKKSDALPPIPVTIPPMPEDSEVGSTPPPEEPPALGRAPGADSSSEINIDPSDVPIARAPPVLVSLSAVRDGIPGTAPGPRGGGVKLRNLAMPAV